MGRTGQRAASAPDPIWSELALRVVLNAYPAATVHQVVGDVGCGEQRDRMLNSALLVHFILALPIFPALGYRDVLRHVLLAHLPQSRWDTPPPSVATSPALSKGRRRLGVEVLEELFRRTAPARSPIGQMHDRAGREVLFASQVAVGANVRSTTCHHDAPLVTAHTLRDAANGHVVAAALSATPGSASAAWRRIVESISEPALLVADHMDDASALLDGLKDRRDIELLWQPAGTLHFLAEGRLADGSVTGRAAVSPGITGGGSERWTRIVDKLGGNPLPIGDRLGDRLMTTILDTDGAPADSLVSLHRTSSAHSTATARHLECLVPRAKDRPGIEQEIWAFLLVQRALHRVACAVP